MDVFVITFRLYQAQLHNNELMIGMKMSEIKLPQLKIACDNPDFLDEDIPADIQQINPSCLLNYLGIKGVGYTKTGSIIDPSATTVRYFNAIKYLGYWDIYKNYYSNKQEGIGMNIGINSDTYSISNIKCYLDNNATQFQAGDINSKLWGHLS